MDKQDFSEKLRKDYEDILDRIERGMLPLVARIPMINKVVSDYVLAQDEYFEELKARGEYVPIQLRDSWLLEKMADLVFYEELSWSHPDKMSIVEYPVMSEWQVKERRDKTSMPGKITHDDRQFNGRRKAHSVGRNGEIIVSNPRIVSEEDDGISQIELKTDVEAMLKNANLTERQRQAIDLTYFEGMTQEEAAVEMGLSHKRIVGRYIVAGIKKIKENNE